MDRNPNDGFNTGNTGQGGTGSTPTYGAGGMGSAGSTGASSDRPEGMRDVPGAPGVYTGGGTPGSSSASGGASTGNFADRAGSARDTATERLGQAREMAGERLGQAREAAASGLSNVRERAGELRTTLADKLEQGAEKLRGGTSGTHGAAYAAPGSISIAADGSAGQLSNTIAGAAQGAADFLRDADMQNLKVGIEKQVRENPARTLLIAVGLGYLIGKAFRR